MRRLFLALLVLASACQPVSPPLPSARWFASTPPAADTGAPSTGLDTAAPPVPETPAHCADPLSWGNTGEPFLLTYCSGCHAETVADAFRYGAPADLPLDSAAQVRAYADRVHIRVADGSMPPTGGPSDAEVDCFLSWLAQGARGAGEPLFATDGLPAAEVAWEVHETFAVEDAFAEGLTLVTTRVGLGRPVAHGVFLKERWIVAGDEAWLVARERFAEDGTPLVVDQWDPPLSLVRADPGTEWTLSTERTRTDASGVEVWDETWDFFRDDSPELDARTIDPEVRQVLAVERSSAAELGIELSERMGLVRRWWSDDSETADPELDHIDILHFESLLPPSGTGVAMDAGMDWSSRILGDVP